LSYGQGLENCYAIHMRCELLLQYRAVVTKIWHFTKYSTNSMPFHAAQTVCKIVFDGNPHRSVKIQACP